jgi:hypothetical protein
MSGDRVRDGNFDIAAIIMFLADFEEALSERIKVYERRLENAEEEAPRGQTDGHCRLAIGATERTNRRRDAVARRLNHLSDAQIKVLLERRKRDERDGVPRNIEDDLHDLGMLEPDHAFLVGQQKGVKEEDEPLAFREAFLALLDTDIPLSRPTRQSIKRELMNKWWPDKIGENRRHRRIRTELIRVMFELAKAVMPLAEAEAGVAKLCGRNSGKALRKALQPNRLNRRG